MTSRILNFLPLVGALLLAACGPASRTDALLNDVESYINEAPDSARRVLQSVDARSLQAKQVKAHYALLRMMAMDKCDDDITIPGLLDDAAWFERHGSPDEKMKYWFYRGRIQEDMGDMNSAAVALARAEKYADKVQDQHARGLLYLAFYRVFKSVSNRSKEQEYVEKAMDLFQRTGDPLTGPCFGILGSVYRRQQKWALADSAFRMAEPYFESNPSYAPSSLYYYAEVKLLRPDPDPAGAIALLDRYKELVGGFGVSESGAYAYALTLLGDKKMADAYIDALRAVSGPEYHASLFWLERIDVARNDYASAYGERSELYRYESGAIQAALDDSVMKVLRDDASRQAEDARVRLRQMLFLGGILFFAMLSLVLLSLLRKGKIQAERDRLVDLREQMQEELEKSQEENAEKAQLISGQEDRIREMEANVVRERETYTRERVNRLRQLGELRSTFWWRERGLMREADAIQRIKKEISYVYQTDNDGVALVRRVDAELDGAVSLLRKMLHLRGKPKEVLFLCCCILDLEPEMVAEIMGTSKVSVYAKRSRLRARVRELNDPLLSVLVDR